MRDKKAAQRYAVATIESISDAGMMERVGSELQAFAATYSESAELRKAMAHPGIPAATKRKIMEKLSAKLSFSATTAKALDCFLRRGRIGLAADIAEAYSALLDERLGRQKVVVTSAFPLTDSEKKDLEKLFSSITGKKPVMDVGVDRSLIGGVVARVGGVVFDGSVRNQLAKMRIKAEV
jgi:F-type H+-transporting ATPase subunit delta